MSDKIKIFTDSSSDLDFKELTYFDIDVLPFSLRIDETEYVSDLLWKDITPEVLTDAFSQNKSVSVSGPLLSLWRDKIEEAVTQGYDVVYIAVSQKEVDSLQAFNSIIDSLQNEGKISQNQRITGIDSNTISLAQGLKTGASANFLHFGDGISGLETFFNSRHSEVYIAKFSSDNNGYSVLKIVDGEPSPVFTSDSKTEVLQTLCGFLPENPAVLKIGHTPGVSQSHLDFLQTEIQNKGYTIPVIYQNLGPTTWASIGSESMVIGWLDMNLGIS